MSYISVTDLLLTWCVLIGWRCWLVSSQCELMGIFKSGVTDITQFKTTFIVTIIVKIYNL